MFKSRLITLAAAACVGAGALFPSGAHAWSRNLQIAFQANTGNLWTWTIDNPGRDTGLGMMAGTSPSVAPMSGIGSDHPIAFQANSGDLWTTGAFGRGNTGLGMQAGTSPSIWGSKIAFTANTGVLYTNAESSHMYVRRGSSPSIAGEYTAYRDANDSKLWTKLDGYPARSQVYTVAESSSPKINVDGKVALQCAGGKLCASDSPLGRPNSWETGLGMKYATSPAINDHNDIAFQADTGNLYILWNGGAGGSTDTGVQMKPGTSPSINDAGDVAFQGANGNLWIWVKPAAGVGSGPHDLGLGMKAGTSPSISLDPGN